MTTDSAVAVANPFGSSMPSIGNAAANTDQARAISETQAAMVIAKRFPRDRIAATDRILNAFSRPSLAEVAQYEYAKGGSDVRGPSIRAAEALAQDWGNVQFGIRELEQRAGESTVEAFAWDMETNTRQVKVFQVPHIRYTRNGVYKLEDPREIYEMTANQGARRLRACILGIIPGDVIDAAMRQADVTLHTKAEVTPERIAALIEKFAAFSVPKEAIEARIQRRLDAMTPAQMVNLGKIYNSLKDGMSKAGDWFELDVAGSTEEAAPIADINAQISKRKKKAPAPPPSDLEMPALSYAEVAHAIEHAADGDSYNAAVDLIRSVADGTQRAELTELAMKRREALEAAARG